MRLMKNFKVLSLVCLMLACVFLGACGEEAPAGGDPLSQNTEDTSAAVEFTEGETVVVADASGSIFTVVRPNDCEDSVINAAITLNRAIKDIIGETSKLKTDVSSKAVCEILVGMTDRAESRNAAEGLGERDFRILFSGTKIAIVGGRDEATAEAVEYFTQNYISDGVLSIKYGEDYTYRYEAPKIMIGDSDLSEYKIYSDGAPEALVKSISDAIYASVGKTPEITTKREGRYIELMADSELDVGYYTAKLQSDGIISLKADVATGLCLSVSSFVDAIKEVNVPGETYEFSLSESGSYPPSFELFDETDERYFLGETSRDALSYEVGEEIEFTISLLADGELSSCARFDWTMVGDDGKSSSGSESGLAGRLTLKTTLDNNGFVMVTVKAIDAYGNEIDSDVRFSGAAGVHPELLTITKEEPADFDEYWAEAIEEMMTVEPEIIEMEEIKGQSGFKAYKMKLACAGNEKWMGDTYVSGYLTYPANASPKSLQIRATFQGYGVYSPSLSCSDGYITFAVCCHSMEIGMDDSYYADLKSGALKGYGWSVAENTDPKNVYYRYMLIRDLQALRFMKEYFGEDGNGLWNGETINLWGSSQGGFQVLAIAALDKDVDSIYADIPWLCDIGGYTDGKKIKSSFRPDFTDGLGYFDSASFASRIECSVTIIAGLGDPLCPPAGVAAMYNALNCPKTITFGQNQTHSYRPKYGDKFTFSDE